MSKSWLEFLIVLSKKRLGQRRWLIKGLTVLVGISRLTNGLSLRFEANYFPNVTNTHGDGNTGSLVLLLLVVKLCVSEDDSN